MQVEDHIRLVMLCNDVTLRNLIPAELAKSFGFFNSKPATAFSPFAVTPDELGDAWKEGRLHHNMKTTYNGTVFGDVAAGPEMHFSFWDIITHICKTRAFTAGTIVGSGTISNEDTSKGPRAYLKTYAERLQLVIRYTLHECRRSRTHRNV